MRTLILLTAVFISMSHAMACSCVEVTDEEAYENSQAVLLVIVTSTRFHAQRTEDEFSSVYAEFDVIETYKGQQGALRHLKVEKNTCGVALVAGEPYLIYSSGKPIKYLSVCTRSRWVGAGDMNLLNSYENRH